MTTRMKISMAIAATAIMVAAGGTALGADDLAPNYDQSGFEGQAGVDDIAPDNEPSRVPGVLASTLIGFDAVVDIIRQRRFNAPDIFTMTEQPDATNAGLPDPCAEGGSGILVFCAN